MNGFELRITGNRVGSRVTDMKVWIKGHRFRSKRKHCVHSESEAMLHTIVEVHVVEVHICQQHAVAWCLPNRCVLHLLLPSTYDVCQPYSCKFFCCCPSTGWPPRP
eukprot:scaffold83837_cov19-Tisochrysis_lutea.AAC.1